MRLVVPFTPGTGPDIIARSVGERLSAKIGKPVVVENIGGALGNIDSQRVARAKEPEATSAGCDVGCKQASKEDTGSKKQTQLFQQTRARTSTMVAQASLAGRL